MLSDILLNVDMLSFIILSAIMLTFIIPCDIMLAILTLMLLCRVSLFSVLAKFHYS
jgi:hypothetical protein